MALDTERVAGFADALQAIEDETRRLLEIAGTKHVPGLEIALATIQATRADVSSYYEYLVDLHEEQEGGWGDWVATETECVPCLAETAPHTCIEPSDLSRPTS